VRDRVRLVRLAPLLGNEPEPAELWIGKAGVPVRPRVPGQQLLLDRLPGLPPHHEHATVVINPRSIEFLKNSTFDFKAELMSQRSVWQNPQAKSNCGCGESFEI
jgi:hypothetical protein